MLSVQIFETLGGFGFHIDRDGVAIIYQPTDPVEPGSSIMSSTRADEAAAEILARLEASD